MSLDALLSVWKTSRASGTRLVVMLILADYANEEGLSWPRLETIARRARIESIDQVSRHIHALRDMGEVSITHCEGTSNLYKILLPIEDYRTSIPPAKTRGVENDNSNNPPRKRGGGPRENAGGVPAKSTNDSLNDSLDDSLENISPQVVSNWEYAREQIRMDTNQQTWKVWIEPLSLVGFENGDRNIYRIHHPKPEGVAWINAHVKHRLESILCASVEVV